MISSCWKHALTAHTVMVVGGVFYASPQVFLKYLKKAVQHTALLFLVYLFIHPFCTSENFRPRSLKIRSTGHIKWPHLRKSLNAHHSHTECPMVQSPWNIQRLIFVPVSIHYKMYIRICISVTQGQVNFVASPLSVNGRKIKGISFGRKPFETLKHQVTLYR